MIIHPQLLTMILWGYLATRNMRYDSGVSRIIVLQRNGTAAVAPCNRATLRPPGPNYLSAGCKWHRLLLRVNHKRRAAKRALRFSASAGIENAEAALGHFEIRSRIATSDIAYFSFIAYSVTVYAICNPLTSYLVY